MKNETGTFVEASWIFRVSWFELLSHLPFLGKCYYEIAKEEKKGLKEFRRQMHSENILK